MLKIKFKANYPHFRHDRITLLPLHKRLDLDTRYDGTGVTIAFIDSGFSHHPDMLARVKVHVDASTTRVTEQSTIPPINDLSWHGQMTSFIGASDGSSSNQMFKGVASGADLIFVKVSTPDFRIKEGDILRGLRWVYDTRHRFNVRVVNVSVGGDFVSHDPNHPLHRIIRKLTDEGICVVVAAGNSGRDVLVPPASSSEAIIVGGYNDHNSLDSKSWTLYHHNYGVAYDQTTKPDILAPAAYLASPILQETPTAREVFYLAQLFNITTQDELAAWLQNCYDIVGLTRNDLEPITQETLQHLQERINHHKVVDAYHQHVDGTSVAAPIVSGIIAHMLQANSQLSPQQVKHILLGTALPIPHFDMRKQGTGIVQARSAVRKALAYRHQDHLTESIPS